MENNLIDRQAAIDAIRGWVKKAFEDWGNAETEIRCFNAIYPLIMALPSAQPQDVFEFDKTYPLAGLQVEITKGAYGDDFITIKRPERFLALDGVVYTQDDDRQGWRGEQDG